MGMKNSMEEFIRFLIINTVGNSKREFTDLNACGKSLILQSRMTLHVSQGTIKLMYI